MLGHLRLTLALGVLAAHTGAASDAVARAMVSAFFVLSGFLMQLTLATHYDARKPWTFYFNRFLRVYPCYWLAVAVVVLAFPAYIASQTPDAFTFVRAIVLSFTESRLIIGPAWTLPFELLYYALAPLIFLLGWRGALAYGLVGAGFFWWRSHDLLLLFQPFGRSAGSSSAAIAASVVLFSLGALAYHVRKRVRPRPVAESLAVGAVGLLIGIPLVLGFLFSRSVHEFIDERGAIAQVTAVLSALACAIFWSGRDVRGGKLAGDLCLPVYLFHWPVVQLWLSNAEWFSAPARDFARVVPNGDYLAYLLATLIFTLAFSAVWLVIDHRLVQRLKIRRRRTLEPGPTTGAMVP